VTIEDKALVFDVLAEDQHLRRQVGTMEEQIAELQQVRMKRRLTEDLKQKLQPPAR